MGVLGNCATFGPTWMPVLSAYQNWTVNMASGAIASPNALLPFESLQDDGMPCLEMGVGIGARPPIGARRFSLSAAADAEGEAGGASSKRSAVEIAFSLVQSLKADLPEMIAQRPDDILPRLKADMAQIPDGTVMVEGYFPWALDALLNSSIYQPARLHAVHYLCTEVARIAFEFSEGDPFVEIDGVGDLHNKLKGPYSFAINYEAKHCENLTSEDKELLTDIRLIFALWGQGQYAAMGFSELVKKAVAQMTLNAAERYEALGLVEKARGASKHFARVRERYDIGSTESKALFMEAIAEGVERKPDEAFRRLIELIVEQKNEGEIGTAKTVIRALTNGVGYGTAAWMNETIADALEQVDGGAKYVQFYRERAAELERIGRTLGFL